MGRGKVHECMYICITNRNHVHFEQVTTPTTHNTTQTVQCHVRAHNSPPQCPVQLWISVANNFPSLLAVPQLPFHSLSPKLCCAAGPSTAPPAFALLCTIAGLCHYQNAHTTNQNYNMHFSVCRYLVSICSRYCRELADAILVASPMVFQAAKSLQTICISIIHFGSHFVTDCS